jgi:ABC-2 type transport system permease protein
MNTNVLSAIFRRNFVAYFSSPTGYVFIALFMFFSSMSAFYPNEFFNANLANLEQLNKHFLWLMLGFVPSITMSIWADERRQGTDELLLTIPANDFEVVAGKYLAAVAIYSVSLAFSLLSNWIMLISMGEPDFGLLLANYIGYWFVGAAMISLGMIGSFLTGNLTVSFVLGFLCIFPFVITQLAESFIPWREGMDLAKRWTFVGPFDDFTRGVISLSSVTYFAVVAVVGLYVCMILIGRRHWLGGRDGSSMLGHFLVRGAALVAIAASVVFVFANHDVIRADATAAKLNSLSEDTRKELAKLHVKEAEEIEKRRETLTKDLEVAKQAAAANKDDKELQKAVDQAEQRLRQVDLDEARIKEPIVVDAYISREVPEAYAAKRLDLISKLREFENLAKDKLSVRIFEIDPASVEADQAKDRHGIEARRVNFETRGQYRTDEIFLGASIRSGLDEVVIKFFELGVPVEYELIQAIVTVSQSERKTLGVVKTDADLYGGTFSFAGGMPESSQPQPIVEELRKHYEVIDVDPNEKIVDPSDPNARKYDVLLVAQPSSLSPPQLANVTDAVMSGVPTAIFEDPLPFRMGNVPGTDQPKRPRQSMGMMMPPPPEEKGDVDTLFARLGVRMIQQKVDRKENDDPFDRGRPPANETLIVWQRYNPYPTLRFLQGLTNQWVFVNDSAPRAVDADGKGCFADDEITSGLYELLFLFPGGFTERTAPVGNFKFTPLVRTGEESGVILYADVDDALRNQTPWSMGENEKSRPARHCLAARIEGEIKTAAAPNSDETKPGEEQSNKPAAEKTTKINAVVVADINTLDEWFFYFRADPPPGLDLQFQNVPFVLNVIDSLAGDDRFLRIRKGRQMYGHLTHVEDRIEEVVTSKIDRQIEEAEEVFKTIENEAEQERKDAEDQARKDFEAMSKKEGGLNFSALKSYEDKMQMKVGLATMQEGLKKYQADKDFKKARDKAIKEGQRATLRLNDTYKAWALLAPPVLPLLVGVVAFLYRRSREVEGAAKSRLR